MIKISNIANFLDSYKNLIFIGLLFRISIYFYFIIFPIYHADFGFVSPLTYHSFTDLNFYLELNKVVGSHSNSIFNIIDLFSYSFKNIFCLLPEIFSTKFLFVLNMYNDPSYWLNTETHLVKELNSKCLIHDRFPGPAFPILLFLTRYSENFTIFLSITIFLLEASIFVLWMKYIYKNTFFAFAFIFCFFPIPLMFGLIHSSDILFYFFSSLAFLSITKIVNIKNYLFLLILLCIAATRPTSIAILLSFVIYLFFFKNDSNKSIKISTILVLVVSTIYYFPYFVTEILVTLSSHFLNEVKFNYQQGESISNVTFKNYQLIPFFFKKLLYLFGFHPSSSNNVFIYLSRYFCALVFLLGYINLLRKYKTFEFWYINLSVIPVVFLFYPAYRYILPFTPILLVNFAGLSLLFFNMLKKTNNN